MKKAQQKKNVPDTPWKNSWADTMAREPRQDAQPPWWGKPAVLIQHIRPIKRPAL